MCDTTGGNGEQDLRGARSADIDKIIEKATAKLSDPVLVFFGCGTVVACLPGFSESVDVFGLYWLPFHELEGGEADAEVLLADARARLAAVRPEDAEYAKQAIWQMAEARLPPDDKQAIWQMAEARLPPDDGASTLFDAIRGLWCEQTGPSEFEWLAFVCFRNHPATMGVFVVYTTGAGVLTDEQRRVIIEDGRCRYRHDYLGPSVVAVRARVAVRTLRARGVHAC